MSLLKPGNKMHVIERQLFEQDVRRHFVGEVQAATDSAVRLRGYVFVYDEKRGAYYRKTELRERIFSMTDGRLILKVISDATALEEVRFETTPDGGLIVTDGGSYRLDVSEFEVGD